MFSGSATPPGDCGRTSIPARGADPHEKGIDLLRRDIDEALNEWPFEPRSGEILAREVKARDGRSVLQIRVELGLLQLEVEGRPDGDLPHGFTTYLHYLQNCHARVARKGGDEAWTMKPENCIEADREFVQFYHRRVAWLALGRYDRALSDAEHTLGLMDFVTSHGMSDEYIDSHERLRGLVLFHRAQASAALALQRRRPEEAVDALGEGIDRLVRHMTSWSEGHEDEELPDPTLIEQLKIQEREIRKSFEVSKTLREQLAEAVAREDYEHAARLRDMMKLRKDA